jgi:hypothetical protein
VAHSGTPTYRGFTFSAKAGDNVEFWVKSADGDALAYPASSERLDAPPQR